MPDKWEVVKTEPIPSEMTFDVHNPDGSVNKKTVKRGGDLADPPIETPLAPAHTNKWQVQSEEKINTDTPPPTGGESPGWRDSVLNFFSPLSTDERKGMENRLGKFFGPVAEGVGNAAMGVTQGFGQILLHPIASVYGSAQTAADALNQMFPDSTLTPRQKTAKDASLKRLKEQWSQIKENPEFTLGALVGGIEAGRVVGDVAKTAPAKFKGAMTKSLEATRKGAQTMVGAGERDVRANVEGTAEKAQSSYESAQAKSQANTESTLEDIAKTKEKRIETRRENKAAAQEHAGKVDETRAENKEALRKQAKIEPTEEKLQKSSEELRGRIETARENALKEGNEKYSGVNETLNPLEADMDAIQFGKVDPETGERINGGLDEVKEKIKGSDTNPPILENFLKRVQRGDLLTYKDLQGYYSELNKELSKGALPGDWFAAYDTLHDIVGDQMQSLAEMKGKGAELKAARDYWRRMKQTFGKPYNPTDAATATMEKSSPEFARAEEQANRLRLLGSFDPEIPKVDQGIQNLRQGLKALGEKKPVREVVKQPPAAPETKELPEFKEPKGSVPFERPEVSTRAIREELLDRWAHGERQLSKFQVRSLIGGGIGAIVGGLFEGTIGAGVGGAMGSALGPVAISRFVEMPAVQEWLTRPPAGELDTLQKLPNADRIKLTDGLKKVAQQAQTKGVRVAPELLRYLGLPAVLGSRSQELQKTRADQLASQQP